MGGEFCLRHTEHHGCLSAICCCHCVSSPWPTPRLLACWDHWDQLPGPGSLFPFPSADFPNPRSDPSRYERYHHTLQIPDLGSSSAICCASLGFVMTFVRLLQFGHLNMSIGHGGEGGLPSVMPLTAARRVAWLRKDRQSLNALASGSVVPLKPRASLH